MAYASSYKRFIQAMLLNVAIAVGFFYLVSTISPKTNLFINLVIFSFLFFLWRSLYDKFIRAVGTTSGLVLMGASKPALELAKRILKRPWVWLKAIEMPLKPCGTPENPLLRITTLST